MRALTRMIALLSTAALLAAQAGAAQASAPEGRKPTVGAVKILKEMNALASTSSDAAGGSGGTISGTAYYTAMSFGSKGVDLETSPVGTTVTLSADSATKSVQMRISNPSAEPYDASFIQNGDLIYMPLSLVLTSLSPAPADEQKQALTAKAGELAPGVDDPWISFTKDTDDAVFGIIFGATLVLASALPTELKVKTPGAVLQRATKTPNSTGGHDYTAVFKVTNTRVNGTPVGTMTVRYSSDAAGAIASSSTRYGRALYSQSALSTTPVSVTVPAGAIAYTDLTAGQ